MSVLREAADIAIVLNQEFIRTPEVVDDPKTMGNGPAFSTVVTLVEPEATVHQPQVFQRLDGIAPHLKLMAQEAIHVRRKELRCLTVH
jgi:hypothetical protein